MKKIYITFAAAFMLSSQLVSVSEASAQCTFGNANANYAEGTNFSADFLLGCVYNNPGNLNLTHLNMFGSGTGSQVKMAIYNNSGPNGSPGALVASTGVHTVGQGNLSFPVLSPITLPAGNYWIMAVYNNSGTGTSHTFMNSGLGNMVYYVAMPFNNSFPTLASNFLSYSGQDFRYWASSVSSATQNITSCGPYTWVNGVTYTENTQGVTFYSEGSSAQGCDEILTLNLTVLPELNLDVTAEGATLTAAQGGASYVWINCATNQPINNATGQSFTATESGNYAVVVSNGNCSDTSACVAVTIAGVGIDNNDVNKNVHIFPNPAQDLVYVNLTEAASIKLYSITGLLLNVYPAQSEHSLNVSDLNAGVYLIQVNNQMYRFIKQ